MPSKPTEIAGVMYPSRFAITTRLRKILSMGGDDDLITSEDDTALLAALFHARPNKVSELNGRTIIGWGRERNPANICFAAVCSDGSKLHFSYFKSLDALYSAQAAAANQS